MDKKELQNLIDRICLTGPGGIKKVKKALKELIDSENSHPMEPLVIEGIIDASFINFIPAAGQPSFDEALSAFLSGRPVLLHTRPHRHDILITNYGGGFGFILYGRLCEYTPEGYIQGHDIAWTK